ncbi:MAG: magnesium transporter [Acidimicrobiales bacterium]
MPRRAIAALRATFRRLVRADAADLRQGLAALLISSVGDLIAGITLGSITGTLERLPGLLVLVPAAIGMRGNIFGALGSRLSTTIHTGQFSLTRRRDTVVGQNLGAALALSLATSLALGVLAKLVALAFNVPDTIHVAQFVVISVLGGMLSSLVVLAVTVAVAVLSVRRNWDLDNVSSPIVTAVGDMVTLPSLFLASFVVELGWVTGALAATCTALGLVSGVLSWRSRLLTLRRIVRESAPVLLAAGVVDIVAGITIEKRLESFGVYTALLVLIPPFLEDSGALGSILSSRVATKLHLGVVEVDGLRIRGVRDDVVLVFLFAAPVFLLVGTLANVAAALTGRTSPGFGSMIGVAMIGGLFATISAVVVALASAVVAHRLELDPDNFGVPVVTSSLDLLGAFSLILAMVILGLA